MYVCVYVCVCMYVSVCVGSYACVEEQARRNKVAGEGLQLVRS